MLPLTFVVFMTLGCVSKRKNCKFEWIWCQFKDGNRRFSGAKSRFSDAEVGSLQGFRVCLIAGRLLTAQSKIETQHLNGAKDAEIAVQGILETHPNRETTQAMLEAERIAKDPSVKGYNDLDALFEKISDS